MKKRNLITYWITTLWLSLGMASTGIVQLLRQQDQVKPILDMGYPSFFLTVLGIWKILGVVAVLVPKFPVIKEWAYAGFFFTTTGAIASHIATKHPVTEMLPALLLLILTTLSWYFRPAERSMIDLPQMG